MFGIVLYKMTLYGNSVTDPQLNVTSVSDHHKEGELPHCIRIVIDGCFDNRIRLNFLAIEVLLAQAEEILLGK